MDASRYFDAMHNAMSTLHTGAQLLLTVRLQDICGNDAYLEVKQLPGEQSALVCYSTMGRRCLNFQLFRKGWQLCHNAEGQLTGRFPSSADSLLSQTDFRAYCREDRLDLAHVTEFLSHTCLAFEPTTYQYYSATAAFDVAARMVELTSGMPFDQFVEENIFRPCGMTDTTFAPTPEQWSRMIVMHNRQDGKSVDAPTVPGCVFEDFPVTWFSGGAGLAATMPDYVRFAEMLCRGGVAEGGRVLSERLVQAMGTATVPETVMPKPQQWGLGVRVITGDYQMPLGCFGWSGAYGTHFWVDPVNRITAVYMKNSRYDGGAGSRTSVLFEQDVYGAAE